MGQALYRKYRSIKFAEVIGQDHIIKTLSQALKQGRISHAYLFTGPRGVGKTSVARILAHEVNGLKYDAASLPLDIIEIDAASNRRIDEIRDLREKVNVTPTSAKYKVYIIDEVHMLTREAFNALLKTLEEPPAHCIFILATTEAHKLPETIISRTQRFGFKPINPADTINHLKTIAQKEKIEISSDALQLLAEHGGGSFRDSIGLMDQLSGYPGKITGETVRKILGMPQAELLRALVLAVQGGKSQKVLNILDKLWEQGVSPGNVGQGVAKMLRSELMGGSRAPWAASVLKQLIDLPSSPSPRDYLEVCLLEASANFSSTKSTVPPAAKADQGTMINSSVPQQPSSTSKKANLSRSRSLENDAKADILNLWPDIVEKSKASAATLYTALRLAQPELDGKVLTLLFEFPLHQKKLNQAKNLKQISDLIETVSGTAIEVRCLVSKEHFANFKRSQENIINYRTKGAGANPVKEISNIFGAAEMLES